MNSQTPILEITNLTKNFNNICAVDKVNFSLDGGAPRNPVGKKPPIRWWGSQKPGWQKTGFLNSQLTINN